MEITSTQPQDKDYIEELTKSYKNGEFVMLLGRPFHIIDMRLWTTDNVCATFTLQRKPD